MTPLSQYDLDQFTGSSKIFKNPFGILYTYGVKHVADTIGAHWLVDAISSHQPDARKLLKGETFQVWKLHKVGESSAILTMQRDTGDPVLIEQKIEFTDFWNGFQGDKFTLWLVDRTLILPSEY